MSRRKRCRTRSLTNADDLIKASVYPSESGFIPYSPMKLRKCFEVNLQSNPNSLETEGKTLLGVLDGEDPNASLAVFQVLLEELKLIPAYIQDSLIFLDMQQLEMHFHMCTKQAANVRISRFEKKYKGYLEKVIVLGQSGHPKVAMELRHVMEYVMAQKGVKASALRRTLIEIACRATAGDPDLFHALTAWTQTMDPKIRAMLMSGYVGSDLKEPPIPLVVVDIYSKSGPNRLTFVQAWSELIESNVSREILASPFGAEIIAVMRERGLLEALTCLREVMSIYLAHETTMSAIKCKSSECAAKISQIKEEIAAKIAQDKEEIAAKIAQDKEQLAAKLTQDKEEMAAKIAQVTRESAAIIKANSARLRLEQAERKQALITKTRLDNSAVDIQETTAWKMREEVLLKKKESEARIRREDLGSAVLRKKERKTEYTIPMNLVTSTAVEFFQDQLHRQCPGLEEGGGPCAENRSITAFRYECVVEDFPDGKMKQESARIVCPGCAYDARWGRRHSVHDSRQRRRAWLYDHGANVRGTCVCCDGGHIHVADGKWQCCHDIPSARGGSASPDHRNIHPGHGPCNVQQGEMRIDTFRKNCGLEAKREISGFTHFKRREFDQLDTQLGSAKPKTSVIMSCLQELNHFNNMKNQLT
jgi:hypothetical protein